MSSDSLLLDDLLKDDNDDFFSGGDQGTDIDAIRQRVIGKTNNALANAPAPADTVSPAVKAAAHGIKVLSPLLTAITQLTDPNDAEQVESLMKSALERVRTDAKTVAARFNVSEEAPAWLISNIAGNLMPVMIKAIERGNGPILEGDSKYLQPLLNLADLAQDAPIKSTVFTGDHDWQMLQALAFATTNVMTEYHAWPYFHTDAQAVAQQINDYLHDRVIEQTLHDTRERWGLTPSETTTLGVTLLHHAGEMLAKCWANGIEGALETVKSLERPKAMQVLAHGYPLDHVFDQFEELYQGIEVSVLAALKSQMPHREKQTATQSANYARPR